MKKIGIFCDWLLSTIPTHTVYGQWEIGIGSMLLPVVAIISFFVSLPTLVLVVVWYKTGTLALALVAILFNRVVHPWIKSVETIFISLHLIDVLPVGIYKKIFNKNPVRI